MGESFAAELREGVFFFIRLIFLIFGLIGLVDLKSDLLLGLASIDRELEVSFNYS